MNLFCVLDKPILKFSFTDAWLFIIISSSSITFSHRNFFSSVQTVKALLQLLIIFYITCTFQWTENYRTQYPLTFRLFQCPRSLNLLLVACH